MRTRTFSLLSISSLAFALVTNLVAETRFSNVAVGVATANESDRMLSLCLNELLKKDRCLKKRPVVSLFWGLFSGSHLLFDESRVTMRFYSFSFLFFCF